MNGKTVFSSGSLGFSEFAKEGYKSLGIEYPKFFKMDNLSKLAFLAAEKILDTPSINMEKEENIAVILSNRASSLDTDRNHQESIKDKNNFHPRPAVFVYTLPNICIGEICIRHQLFSENSFFIFDSFNASYLKIYAEQLLVNKKAKKVLCGWVDFDKEHYEAFLYLVEEKGIVAHHTEKVENLYHQWIH